MPISTRGRWSLLVVLVTVMAAHYHLLARLTKPPALRIIDSSRLSERGTGAIVGRLMAPIDVEIATHGYGISDINPPLITESKGLIKSNIATERATKDWEKEFFPRDMVDEPVFLVGEWQIYGDEIPTNSLSNLIFTAWIDEYGNILKWNIDGQTPSGNWAIAALSNIGVTKMLPAKISGRTVASIATFEIGFDTRPMK